MRVDQSRIPEGEKVKIRCPKCGEIQPYVNQAIESGEHESTVSLQNKARSTLEKNGSIKHPEELTIPSDAFQDFRFPAERGPAGQAQNQKSATRPRNRISALVIVIISFAIIALFAAIVNIILPGPAGQRPVSGMPEWEERVDGKTPASR